MTDRKLGLYLEGGLRDRVAGGGHNFFAQVVSAFKERGFAVDFYPNTASERIKSVDRKGFSLFHLETPTHDRALDVRLAYLYPFWRIERAQWRADYRVSVTDFVAADVDGDEAEQFFRFWRRRLKKKHPNLEMIQKEYVFIPLQGRLTEHRKGQSMSPVDMISATLEGDKFRKIVIKLHPSENYSTAEMDALKPFRENPRISFSEAPSFSLLGACEYVVTENSTVAFEGFFHRKPAILFADSDFHHMCQNVNKVGADLAFRNILATRNPYARYMYWFLQQNCINAGRAGAGQKIIQDCQSFGWQI